MKISDFSISPAMLVVGEEFTLHFTIQTEKNDTIGENGLRVWMRIPGVTGELAIYRDTNFTIAKNSTKAVDVKHRLSLGGYDVERGSVIPSFGIQLGNFGSRVDVSFPVTILEARYSPVISVFAAERSNGSEINDEGENLLADIALKCSAEAITEDMSLQLYYQNSATPEAQLNVLNLTSLRDSALREEISAVISATFSKSEDWNVLLRFGDAYEFATAAIFISKSFANVHLSGMSTGGVCFGAFSQATEGNPLFQCYYPSHFYGPAQFHGGIIGVNDYSLGETDTGGRWFDGKRIYRKVIEVGAKTSNNMTLDVSALDIETYIDIRSMFYAVENYGNGYVFGGAFAKSDNDYVIQVEPTNRATIGISSVDRTWKSGFLIIEYTKSTQEVS